MKGKIFLFIFALPFFSVGAWMAYSIGSDFVDAWRMQDWYAVEAKLSNAGYSSHSGDDSTTYEAFATYAYEVNGFSYSASRVGLSAGADNIGDYQQDTGGRLRSAWQASRPITVFVNPENPADAIIDREVRWGLIGFRAIFVLVFGGFGAGMMFWAVKSPRKKDASDPKFVDRPWLANDAWQTSTIRSSSKTAMYGAWVFAVVWNAISAPLPFVIYGEVLDKDNFIALVGLLFPVVGLFLAAWAIRLTRQWQRFGPTPVSLDPFPGSIGAHVGGTIDVRLPYDAAHEFKLTLTNLKSYISGSGKNRSRREKADWQDSQVAFAEPAGSGTRLTFQFDVPPGLKESEANPDNDSYYLWRLNVRAQLPGADFDRDFEIPVYATGQESAELARHAVQTARSNNAGFEEAAAVARLNLSHTASGRRVYFPMGRNLGSGMAGIVVGGAFAAVGWFLAFSEGRPWFGSVFGGMGALVAIGCLYMILNSLSVHRETGQLIAVRRLLGVVVNRKSMPLSSIERLSSDSSMQTQSGGKHQMHYSLYAHDSGGNKMCVGEGFQGKSEADAALEILKREFGMSLRQKPTDYSQDFDALAAD